MHTTAKADTRRLSKRKPSSQFREPTSTAEFLLRLQRTAGNQAVSSLIEGNAPWPRNGVYGAFVQRNRIAPGAETAELEQLELGGDSAMSEKQKRQWHATARGVKDTEHHNVTITNPNYVGIYERAGADHDVPYIHVGPQASVAGGERLTRLMSDYNEYTPLLRATLRAMGRLKDLENAGAKLDPAALAADPKLAAKFKVNPDVAADTLGGWSSEATHEKLAVANMAAGFQRLNAAVLRFREAQDLLKARRKKAELGEAQEKKAKIDETVDTLEKIIDRSVKFAGYAGKIETFLETTGSLKDLEEIEAKESYEQTRSKQQSVAHGADWSKAMYEKHHEKVEGWLKNAGLNTHDVLIFLTGNSKEYDRLTKQIGELQQKIAELGFEAETERIKAAQVDLGGMKQEIWVLINTASVDREAARGAAGAAGRKLAGDEGALAMYAAQAYQDLRIYGGAANNLRESRLDRDIGWLWGFLQSQEGNNYRARAQAWADDWITMRDWGQEMVEQRDFFSTQQKEWNEKAAAWNEFFAEMSGGNLVKV